MTSRKFISGVVLSTVLIFAASSQALSAQGLWGIPSYDTSVALELAKPFTNNGEESFPSSGGFLSVTWPLTEKIRFVGELPFVYAWWDGDTEAGLGNPYLGLSIGEEGSNLLGQVGVRLPLGPDEIDYGRMIGLFSDYVNRQGAHIPETVPLTGTLTYIHRQETGFVAMATGGADLWFSTNGGGDGVEAFGLYGGRAGYEDDTWSVLGGIAGRAFLTGDGGTLAENTIHELGLEMAFKTASVQPKFFVRLPLDQDVRDSFKAAAGFGLKIAF
ncbi:MAG: hypothetical protein KJN92_01780 [Gemmatimonadetes bacterium]|nr:hypothetical protein [Gemmatimonadota bacterium]